MKALPNIEKSAFRKGEYIGYCNGAQRIRRCGAVWQTYALGSATGTPVFIYAATLEEMSRRLTALKK